MVNREGKQEKTLGEKVGKWKISRKGLTRLAAGGLIYVAGVSLACQFDFAAMDMIDAMSKEYVESCDNASASIKQNTEYIRQLCLYARACNGISAVGIGLPYLAFRFSRKKKEN